jgi:hypothetical protein
VTLRGEDTERERLATIAYHALWQLFEDDPAGEPEHFKRTRLDLHHQLDGDGDLHLESIGANEGVVPRPELRLVSPHS